MINFTELAPLEQRNQIQKLLNLNEYELHDLIIKMYILEGLDIDKEVPPELQHKLLSTIKDTWLDVEQQMDKIVSSVYNAYEANMEIKDIIEQLGMLTDWFLERWES